MSTHYLCKDRPNQGTQPNAWLNAWVPLQRLYWTKYISLGLKLLVMKRLSIFSHLFISKRVQHHQPQSEGHPLSNCESSFIISSKTNKILSLTVIFVYHKIDVGWVKPVPVSSKEKIN